MGGEINLIRGSVVKRGVTALLVVKAYTLLQSVAQLGAAAERMQVKVVVLDGPPQAFYKNVALAPAAAVHADGDFVVFENLSEQINIDSKGSWRNNIFVERLWESVKY